MTTDEGNAIGHEEESVRTDCKSLSELKELASGLVKYLRDNYDPHCAVVVGYDYAKVVRDELGVPFSLEEFYALEGTKEQERGDAK